MENKKAAPNGGRRTKRSRFGREAGPDGPGSAQHRREPEQKLIPSSQPGGQGKGAYQKHCGLDPKDKKKVVADLPEAVGETVRAVADGFRFVGFLLFGHETPSSQMDIPICNSIIATHLPVYRTLFQL